MMCATWRTAAHDNAHPGVCAGKVVIASLSLLPAPPTQQPPLEGDAGGNAAVSPVQAVRRKGRQTASSVSNQGGSGSQSSLHEPKKRRRRQGEAAAVSRDDLSQGGNSGGGGQEVEQAEQPPARSRARATSRSAAGIDVQPGEVGAGKRKGRRKQVVVAAAAAAAAVEHIELLGPSEDDGHDNDDGVATAPAPWLLQHARAAH
jgi:hypothetical protein